MIVDHCREQIVRAADGVKIAGEVQVDVLHGNDLRVAAAGRAALHPKAGAERGLAQAQHGFLADVIERVRQSDGGGGLSFSRRRRSNSGNQNELSVRPALERFDEIHRYLGLVVAIGLKVLRRDAKLLARNLHDRALLRGLRNLDVRLGTRVLRRSARRFGGGGSYWIHASLVPGLSFTLPANSPAAVFGPSEGCTRRTLMRPSAHTTVKPSGATSTTSAILPPMPLGSFAGSGLPSNTFSVFPFNVVQAPGAGLHPRIRRSICSHGLPQSMRALSGPQRPS